MNKRSLGTYYEQAVKAYLVNNGIKILEMNYRCRIGEIDIIGIEEECLVFFEVKYRKDSSYGSPFEAINIKKQNTIRKVAQYYSLKLKWDGFYRFDCIGICGNEINWLKNAF